METSIDDTYGAVIDALSAEVAIDIAMDRLIAHCSKVRPDEVWTRIRDLDFAAGARQLQSWLERVLVAEPPRADIAAFWFGLFDEVGEDGRAFSSLYISGAEIYDSGDVHGAWACAPSYFPEQRYAASEILRSISSLLSDREEAVSTFGSYVLPLGFSALAIRHAQRSLPATIWLQGRQRRAIAVGFDSGDFVTLPEITTILPR